MKRIDLAGVRVGRLTVLGVDRSEPPGKVYWKCLCDCGRIHVAVAHVLQAGILRSCGCLKLAPDLVGRTFYMWTVLSPVVKKKGRGVQRYVCRCACGKIKTVRRRELMNGLSKSCGCWQDLGPELSAIRGLQSSYKKSARTRNLTWELTEDQFREITSTKCHYCGIDPSQKHKTNGKLYIYNGIDRVDPTGGYSLDNIVPCCKTCNFAKLSMTRQEFLEWIERVYNHSIKS